LLWLLSVKVSMLAKMTLVRYEILVTRLSIF
jgi:hypothetical protein